MLGVNSTLEKYRCSLLVILSLSVKKSIELAIKYSQLYLFCSPLPYYLNISLSIS